MPYHAPAAFSSEVARLAAEAGVRARHRVIGTTVEGRDIDAVTVAAPGRRPSGDRPQALVVAAMHGCEVISSELALALLGELSAQPPRGSARAVLDAMDLTIVPCLNVDGRTAALASLDRPGWFVSAPRRNAHGVDLNRNWPFPAGVGDHWLPISGTRRRWLPWYRGPAPLSEPETAALASLAEELVPLAVLNLHSTGAIVTHPWSSRAEAPADQAGFDAMIAAFRAAQPDHVYRAKQSRAWYPIIGSSNDWFHDRLGALAITVETSPPAAAVKADWRRGRRFFWYANPAEPDEWIANDLTACLAALLAAHRWRLARDGGGAEAGDGGPAPS